MQWLGGIATYTSACEAEGSSSSPAGATYPTRCKIGTGNLKSMDPSESCMHVNVYVAHLCVLSIAYRLIEGAFL